MKKGDIVLIIFPFTDLSGTKIRPALIMGVTKTDLSVLFITTQLKWQEATDVILIPDQNNGIKKQSLILISKMVTLDKTLVQGKIGYLNNIIQKQVDNNLKVFLQII